MEPKQHCNIPKDQKMVFWRRNVKRKFERQHHDIEPFGFGKYLVIR